MKTIRFIIYFGIFPALIHAQSFNFSESEIEFSTKWDTLIYRMDSNEGHLKLHTNKWLMCFLHWRPLTPENADVTPEYVREKLITFWGPNMAYFTLKEGEGEMEINGHRAYYVNGDFMGQVDTRFIIWNCEETQRQFIADLNINKLMGTPGIYLELQQMIAETVTCHCDFNQSAEGALTRFYRNDTLKIAFKAPSHWKTSIFETEIWYPEGPSAQSASLWTLSTTSEKQIDILWHKKENELNEKSIQSFFDRAVVENNLNYENIIIDSIYTFDNVFRFKGKYTLVKEDSLKERYSRFSNTHQFVGEAVEISGNIYFLVASIIKIDKVWGLKVDLPPDEKDYKDLLNHAREILNQTNKP